MIVNFAKNALQYTYMIRIHIVLHYI